MIDKIISVQNIGALVDCKTLGDTTFRRLTLFFGENASGKTTLAAILRSLKTGDPELVNARLTLGSALQPEVHILAEGENFRLRDSKWSRTLPNMEISDQTFVNENVCSGDMIAPEHRRQLHRFAIGEQGVELSKKIDGVVQTLGEVNQAIREAEQVIKSHLHGGMSVQDFVALESSEDVDEAIQRQQRRLADAVASPEIAGTETLSAIALPVVPFSAMEELLRTTVDDLDRDAERLVQAHIERNLDTPHGEAWLDTGLQYVRDDACPFCGQSLRDLPLIRAYRHYFVETYRSLKSSVVTARAELDELLSEDVLLDFQKDVQEQDRLAKYWGDHANVEPTAFKFEKARSVLANVKRTLNEYLDRKLASPLDPVRSFAELETCRALYADLVEEVRHHNERIGGLNLSIGEKKAAVAGLNVQYERAELERLENLKHRFEPAVASACTNYKTQAAVREDLLSKSSALRTELKELNRGLLAAYQSRINGYLQSFGATFSLQGLSEEYVQGIPRVGYSIRLRGCKVPLSSFPHTLGSSDRSALALAFFLARLDSDPQISDKIIVLDDPFCSLDLNRRSQTQTAIVEIASKAKQVILMCHEPNFLRSLWEDYGSRIDTKTVRVAPSGPDASSIVEWDIAVDTSSAYYRDYITLTNYLEHPQLADPLDVARAIRPLVEGNLRYRFPWGFGMHDDLGRMIGIMRDGADERFASVDLDELTAINIYSREFLHSDPAAPQPPISHAELTSFIRRAVRSL